MAVTFDIFVKRFGNLKAFILKDSKRILVKENDRIVKMQQDQHREGKNADDKTMQSGYSTGYAKQRKNKGLQTRFVDLHFTGKYHKGLKVKPTKDGANVESNVEYEQYLRERYPNMAGLSKKNSAEIGNILANKLAPEIKKYLIK